MRYCKYRLLRIIESKCRDPYNGDAYVFLSKNRKTKAVYFLYDNDDSRGTCPIQEFLADYSGAIQSDGYVVCRHLAKDKSDLLKFL
ncbi:IS66 family transposase [Parabacteroides sp.]